MIHKVKKMLFFVIYLTMSAHALASIIVDPKLNEIDISHSIMMATTNRDFKLFDIQESQFTPNLKNSLATGYNDGLTFVKFTLKNPSDKAIERVLYLNSINGVLNLYSTNENLKDIKLLSTSGTEVPFNLRPIPGIFGALPIILKSNTEQNFLLTIVSQHNINAKLIISTIDQLNQQETTKNRLLDFYAGGIILLILYNLFIYFFLKDQSYIHYCLYATSFLLVGLTITGYLDQTLRPNNFTFSHYLICFSSWALFNSAFFALHFLEIKKYRPKLTPIFNYFIGISLILLTSGLTSLDTLFPKFFGLAIDINIILGVIFFIWAAFKTIKYSFSAKFYLISWSFLLLSITIWFGMSFGLLKVNTFTLNSIPIANMAEMLIVSLALAYRIQILHKEKLEALERAKDKERYERLVRVLSHDVANSLTVVNTYANKILKMANLDENIKGQIQKISHSGDNIKNILQIVREQQVFTASKSHLELKLINVFDCLHFAKTLHEDTLSAKNIDLEIRVPTSLQILADQTCFINNIVNNIISNAIKFSFENSKIEIYSTVSPDFVYICFQDFGTGIKGDLINDIFFTEKLISTTGTSKEKGHGLGTSLIREYINIFNGKMEVSSITKAENSSNHGTLIKLIFPKKGD